jgi:hypothetical protein
MASSSGSTIALTASLNELIGLLIRNIWKKLWGEVTELNLRHFISNGGHENERK